MKEELGRRAQNKQRTRQSIRRAAMLLFARHGFDSVTTAQVAEASGVSAATLFNYFATKEDLFFGQVEQLERELAHVVSSVRPGQSILHALQGHVVYELTAGRAFTDPSAVASFHTTLVRSPHLRGREAEIYERRVLVLTRALALAMGLEQDALAARVAARQFVAAEQIIASELRDRLAAGTAAERALRDLDLFVDDVFRIVRTGVGSLPSRRPEHAAATAPPDDRRPRIL